jgi:hypothetical protein
MKMKSRWNLFVSALLLLLLSMINSCGGDNLIPPFNLFESVAVADLNGDGLLDVAACYTYVSGPPPHPGYVAVYLQDPARTGTFFPAKIYSVGNDPISIAVGDLNGDGKLDIVTANTITNVNGSGESSVSVLLQDPSAPGTFLAAKNYATGKSPLFAAIGDLNGDGLPDIAAADRDGISILFQNPASAGTFLPRTSIGISKASSVTIGDLNGDGKLDLVVTSTTAVLVLLQDPAVAGSFLAPTNYIAGPQPYSSAIGDLDGDGRPDIVIANFGSVDDGSGSGVSVLLQNPFSAGNFLTAVNYNTDVRAVAAVIADLNGDGKADLAVANTGSLFSSTSVSILLQNGAVAGQFQAAINYPATGDDFVTWVAVGDMNGDGKPDLVIAQSSGVFIRFQDPLNAGQFLAATPISR